MAELWLTECVDLVGAFFLGAFNFWLELLTTWFGTNGPWG
jgi:hypothetical protein